MSYAQVEVGPLVAGTECVGKYNFPGAAARVSV